MTIQIPTYGVVFDNEFYGRKTSGLVSHGEKIEPSTELLWISKFREPTQAAVLDFTVEQAKKLKVTKSKKAKTKLDLGDILESFSFLIDPISQKDEETLKHLKRHYEDGGLQEGRYYLVCALGDVPDARLEEAKKFVKKKGKFVYGECLRMFGANALKLRLRLLGDSLVPEHPELEYLVGRGVKVSDVFSVDGQCKEYQKIADLIKLIYSTFDEEKVKKLFDWSSGALKTKAKITLNQTAQCQVAQAVARGLPDMFRNLFGQNLFGQQKPNQEE